MRRAPVLMFLAVVLAPAVAHAEVMDKEPALASIWIAGAGAALIGLVAGRVRPALAGLSLALTLLVFWALALGELWDPQVGPAIRHEAPGYAGGVYLAGLLAVAGHVAGIAWGRRDYASAARRSSAARST